MFRPPTAVERLANTVTVVLEEPRLRVKSLNFMLVGVPPILTFDPALIVVDTFLVVSLPVISKVPLTVRLPLIVSKCVTVFDWVPAVKLPPEATVTSPLTVKAITVVVF